jgi:hypothetical protein
MDPEDDELVRDLKASTEVALYRRGVLPGERRYPKLYSLAVRAPRGVTRTPLSYVHNGSSNATFAVHGKDHLLLRVSREELVRGTPRFVDFDAAAQRESHNMEILAWHGIGPGIYHHGYARSRKGTSRADKKDKTVRYISLVERFDSSLEVPVSAAGIRDWSHMFLVHDVELALMDLYVRSSALMRCIDTKGGNVVVKRDVGGVTLRLIDVDAAYCGVISNPQHKVLGCVHAADFYAALRAPRHYYESPLLAASVSLLIHCVQAAAEYNGTPHPRPGFPYVRTARMLLDNQAALVQLIQQDYARDQPFYMALLRNIAATRLGSGSGSDSDGSSDFSDFSDLDSFAPTWRKTGGIVGWRTADTPARNTAAGRVAHYNPAPGTRHCADHYDTDTGVAVDVGRDRACIVSAFDQLRMLLQENETRVFAVCCGIGDGAVASGARTAHVALYDAVMNKRQTHRFNAMPAQGALTPEWLLAWLGAGHMPSISLPSWSAVYWQAGQHTAAGGERAAYLRSYKAAPPAAREVADFVLTALLFTRFPVPASLRDMERNQSFAPQRVQHAYEVTTELLKRPSHFVRAHTPEGLRAALRVACASEETTTYLVACLGSTPGTRRRPSETTDATTTVALTPTGDMGFTAGLEDLGEFGDFNPGDFGRSRS